MASEGQKARCVNCRSDVLVPETYAHGDHIKCGTCGTKHKVSRGEVLRLVLADTTPLKEALAANRQALERLEAELRSARGSFGLGVNGFGLGVVYLLWEVAMRDQSWSKGLLATAIVIAIVTGALLELANYLFLAKRQAIMRLTVEIEGARAEGARIRQQLREADRL